MAVKEVKKYPRQNEYQLEDRQSGIGDVVRTSAGLNVTNITTNDIRNVNGVSSNAVGELHNSTSNNKYSWFGPYQTKLENSTSGGVIHQFYPDRSMGHFAGYNHDAIQPYMHINEVADGGLLRVKYWEGEAAPSTVDMTLYPHFGEMNLEELFGTQNPKDITFRTDYDPLDGNGYRYSTQTVVSDYTTDSRFDSPWNKTGDIGARIPITVDDIPQLSGSETTKTWYYILSTRWYPSSSLRQHLLPNYTYRIRVDKKHVVVIITVPPTDECTTGKHGEFPSGTEFKYNSTQQRVTITIPQGYYKIKGQTNCQCDNGNGHFDSSGNYNGNFRIYARWFPNCDGTGAPKSVLIQNTTNMNNGQYYQNGGTFYIDNADLNSCEKIRVTFETCL